MPPFLTINEVSSPPDLAANLPRVECCMTNECRHSASWRCLLDYLPRVFAYT
jgi:hypothetical protein